MTIEDGASRERERIVARVKETAKAFNITRDLSNYTLLMLVEGCWCLHCQQLMGLAREAMKAK